MAAAVDTSCTPGWCRRLIAICVPPGLHRESLLGDLEEEMLELARRGGPLRARFRHRMAILGVALRYLRSRAVRRHPRTLAISPHDREPLMQSILQDVGYGLRTLRNNPASSLVVILMLSVGIGPTVATFAVAETALLRALPFAEPDRLVVGETTFEGRSNPMGSAQDWADYRERSDSFVSLAAISGFSAPVTAVARTEADRVGAAMVSADLFATLGVEPAQGRSFAADEVVPGGPDVVVISHEYWQTRLDGAADAVGGVIRVDGRAHTVVGIMPAGFHFLWDVELWRPLRLGGDYARARRFHNWLMIGRLRPGVDLAQAQADVDAVSRQLQEEYPDSNASKALRLVRLQDALAAPVAPRLLLLMATAAAVLLVACANVASLLLARGAARESELAVRAALGAARARIARQLLTESVVLGLIAGGAGMVVAIWLQGAILDVVPLDLLGVERLRTGPGVLLFALAVSLAASVLFGAAPALRIAPRQPAAQLAGSRTSTGGGQRFRSALVVGQVTLAVVLLVGAGLLARSFARLSSQDPGFVTERLLTAEIDLSTGAYGTPEERLAFFRTFAARARTLPGVEDVALATQLPIRDPGNNVAIWNADQDAEGEHPLAYTRAVLPGYFRTLGIPLEAGRPLDDTDVVAGAVSLVVSRSLAARLFGAEPAVGRRVMLDWGEVVPATVVGVVADVRVAGLAFGDNPTYYYHYGLRPQATLRLAVRTRGAPAAVAGPLRELLRELDPSIPLAGVATMDALIAGSVSGERLISVSLAVLSTIALLLAVVGLYGILAHAVARRRREIGLRVALGARPPDVLALVVRRGMLLVLAGVALGLPAAVAANRLVERFLFEVGTADPVTLAAVPALLAVVGLAACLAPALRAVRVDPAIALRGD